jgi:hypothetical protein
MTSFKARTGPTQVKKMTAPLTDMFPLTDTFCFPGLYEEAMKSGGQEFFRSETSFLVSFSPGFLRIFPLSGGSLTVVFC